LAELFGKTTDEAGDEEPASPAFGFSRVLAQRPMAPHAVGVSSDRDAAHDEP
jgi:hypothetical protein